jgi:NAD(P)-dependent dehydrogenase (short-subunit alcohol dehydrogenase family)
LALLSNELTCLVNNAAFQVMAPVNELTASDWQESMNINVTAPFLLVQALLPLLEAARGSVINTTSVHAKLTKPNFVAYATTKAALEGLTRALAVETGSRVRVNAIAPAAIATSMLRGGLSDDVGLNSLANFHPTQTIGGVEDVAEIAVCLAHRKNNFLNGAVVGLDGGIGARLHDPR